MEENQNYGIPAQGSEQMMESTFVGEEMNTDIGVNEEPMVGGVVQEPIIQEAQVQEAQVQEAQVQPAAQIEQQVTTNSGETKIVVKTSLLKEALKKADTVAGKNDLQPVTEVVMFRVTGPVVQVRSTDRDNILTVNVPVVEATDGVIMTLRIAEIKPLIDRLTSENTTFVINNNVVEVIANTGSYKFNQSVDLTTNDIIVLPDIDKDSITLNETVELDKSQILPYFESVYPMVSGVADTSVYAGVYLGETISATTGDSVGVVKENLMPILNATAYIKLSTIKAILTMGAEDKVHIGFGQLNGIKTMCFYANDYRLYSVLKEGEDEYPLEDINNLLNSPKGTSIKLNRTALLGTIDRLNLFFASNVVRKVLDFSISNGRLRISNESKAFEEYAVTTTDNLNIKLDIIEFVTTIKSLKTDDIIIEPVIDGDAPISLIQISNGDKVVFVINTAL